MYMYSIHVTWPFVLEVYGACYVYCTLFVSTTVHVTSSLRFDVYICISYVMYVCEGIEINIA